MHKEENERRAFTPTLPEEVHTYAYYYRGGYTGAIRSIHLQNKLLLYIFLSACDFRYQSIIDFFMLLPGVQLIKI